MKIITTFVLTIRKTILVPHTFPERIFRQLSVCVGLMMLKLIFSMQCIVDSPSHILKKVLRDFFNVKFDIKTQISCEIFGDLTPEYQDNVKQCITKSLHCYNLFKALLIFNFHFCKLLSIFIFLVQYFVYTVQYFFVFCVFLRVNVSYTIMNINGKTDKED